MIRANQAVFGMLDSFCADRDDIVRNAAADRWVATSARDRRFLKSAVLSAQFKVGSSRRIARYEIGTMTYICTIGFEHGIELAGKIGENPNAGMLTTFLSELKPRPRASTTEIRNIVEAMDRTQTHDYSGHDAELIASLFPQIKVLPLMDIAPDDSWRIFFLICIEECMHGESWIGRALANTLTGICELEMMAVPYRTLCRSVFDSDPAAMFLALYRCVEGLYAVTSAKRVISALNLQVEWATVAETLEDELGWHPREENSLSELMTYAAARDLKAVFIALGETLPSDDRLIEAAGRRIYRIRNSLVHYRPAQIREAEMEIDWDVLCDAMANIVGYIYSSVFPASH